MSTFAAIRSVFLVIEHYLFKQKDIFYLFYMDSYGILVNF